ncbi:chromate transporter [Clostridium algidicarnis]|uniref:Chromate transporter n=1 Tax=Clostridium algidicarnis TaxID=37659 RepID=A0ABS6C5Y1_9CLOT|nr:chromate transporter [Clostridium algidicarnis]MBU3220883.1 chromate transporter [Clostridium algidicarnis]
MNLYLELFLCFAKIGAFTLGGGYAMVPLIEKEVVDNKGWLDKQEFIDSLALAQSAPGPIAVNTAVFVGYKSAGFLGAICTTLGAILPSFLIILIIALFFRDIKDNIYVEKSFKAIRPAIVALIAAPLYRMGKNAGINKRNIIIPILVAVLIAFFNITPILFIVLAAIGGMVYGKVKEANK